MKDLVIKSLSHYFSNEDIVDAYAIGSFASGESCIFIKNRDKICLSDFDGIIDLTPAAYIKYYFNKRFDYLSNSLTDFLKAKGLETHVTLKITCSAMPKFFSFSNPNTVSMYELRSIMGKDNPAFYSSPSRQDIINLVYSSIADFLFIKLDNDNIDEKCYIISKRCLTLLYSLLLFKNIHPKTYRDRAILCEKEFKKLVPILSSEDVEILQILTDFRFSGDLMVLKRRLSLPNSMDALIYLASFFRNLASKVLLFELSNFNQKQERDLCIQNREYAEALKISYINAFCNTLFHTLGCLKNRRMDQLRLLLFSSLHEKMKIDDWVRYCVGMTFVYSTQKNSQVLSEEAKTASLKKLWLTFMM
jgi:hypothetical protein